MKIVIPSHARSHIMVTWKNLPQSIKNLTSVAVYPEEQDDYQDYPLLVLPEGIKGIANKRNFIVQSCEDNNLVILDDDLTFAVRREEDDDPTKFTSATEHDIIAMFQDIEAKLHHYAHGAIATREGGNRNISRYKYNTRALRAHFFRTDILRMEGIHLNGQPFMSDFDTTLQLLERGYQNVVLNHYVTNQGGSNSVGGCSTTRTLEGLEEAAYSLKARHPAFVKVVRKTTKGAWGGGVRTDVIIQWKKAYRSAKEVKLV